MLSAIGLGGSIHDFSACLLRGDGQFYCCEVERLIRRRYATNYEPEHLPAVKLLSDIAANDKIDAPILSGDDMISMRHFPNRYVTNHHDAHAAATFFQSPYEEADILVIDGVGSSFSAEQPEKRETVSYYVGRHNSIRLIKRIYGSPTSIRFKEGDPRIRNNSLGDYYRFFTQLVGFGYLEAGKLMGLAPYGKGELRHITNDLIDLCDDGGFSIFREERALQDLICNYKDISLAQGQHHDAAELAHLAQFGVEEIIRHCARWLSSAGGGRNLCVAGGVGQNAIAMGRLHDLTDYQSVFVDNAPGDSGAALGSAILALMPKLESTGLFRLTPNPFSHPFREEDYAAILAKAGLKSSPCDHRSLAKAIADGKVIALFEGSAEFGARALGHRSILADARPLHMKDRLNSIKGREWFRPIAPCILGSAFEIYFDSDLDCRFMQYIVPTTQRAASEIPSAVHVDGSARVQRLTDEDSALHGIVSQFSALTGVPVLLNTSFNVKGRPIVHTFSDAINDFQNSGIDGLYFNGEIVWK